MNFRFGQVTTQPDPNVKDHLKNKKGIVEPIKWAPDGITHRSWNVTVTILVCLLTLTTTESIFAQSGSEEPVSNTVMQEATPNPTEPDHSGISRHQALITSLTIFVLAIFVGFEVITKVPPMLHTPLMSGSNAISGITIVGALIAAGGCIGAPSSILGLLAVILASINVVGGFVVTGRMLAMFQKKKA